MLSRHRPMSCVNRLLRGCAILYCVSLLAHFFCDHTVEVSISSSRSSFGHLSHFYQGQSFEEEEIGLVTSSVKIPVPNIIVKIIQQTWNSSDLIQSYQSVSRTGGTERDINCAALSVCLLSKTIAALLRGL